MKRQVLLGAIVVGFLATPLTVFGQNEAFAPTYNEGERWEYDVKVDFKGQGYRSDKLESGVYRVEIKNGEIDGDEVFLRGRATIYDSSAEHKWLDFPLQIGKKWSYRYFREEGKRGRWETPEVTVVGLETVTTKAGSFRAFKIAIEEEHRSSVYWYSPKTKSAVKFYRERYHRRIDETSKMTSELSAYSVQEK